MDSQFLRPPLPPLFCKPIMSTQSGEKKEHAMEDDQHSLFTSQREFNSCKFSKEITTKCRDEQQTLILSTSVALQALGVEDKLCSPKGVIDNGLSCSSDTSSSKSSTSCSTQGGSRWRSLFHSLRQKSFKRLSAFPTIDVSKFWRERNDGNVSEKVEHCSGLFKPSWKSFSLSELETATDNFSYDHSIGKGGYSEVYRGCLQDGQIIAIKRLSRGTTDERVTNFLSEVGILVHVNHPNVAKLLGYCTEGGMHLVFQFSPNGSLGSLLHDSKEKLEWSVRFRVALEVAQGLHYLHEKCLRRIIHRDIKAANILLMDDFKVQICDFGLAKWLPDHWSHHVISCFEGTFGYLAPEYIIDGIVNEKTDVFAYGVLLLELITGRPALDSSGKNLVLWAKPFFDNNDITSIVDNSFADSYDHTEINRMATAALQCIQHSAIRRPKMSQVLEILRGEEDSTRPTSISQQKFGLQRSFSEEIFDVEEYDVTKYLNDLKHHKQLLALDL